MPNRKQSKPIAILPSDAVGQTEPPSGDRAVHPPEPCAADVSSVILALEPSEPGESSGAGRHLAVVLDRVRARMPAIEVTGFILIGHAAIRFSASASSDQCLLQRELACLRLGVLPIMKRQFLVQPDGINSLQIDSLATKLVFVLVPRFETLLLVDFAINEKDRPLSADGSGNARIGFTLICDADA